jgi:Zn-dependent peptidase ImmA (M78 family)
MEMNKQFEKDLLEAGFVKDKDPMFPYKKELIECDEVEELDLYIDDIPCLLFGNSGINKGFCVYTSEHFIFFNASNPKEAVKWAEKITNFESV